MSDVLNDLDMSTVPELIAPQTPITPGGASLGFNGTFANSFFSGSGASVPGEKDVSAVPRFAGDNAFSDLNEMKLNPPKIKAPSWLPTGLFNGVYTMPNEGADI